ncbi:MAG: DNA adenine methylase [Defluviitaleaceae bacterium]|nr:DNA adenine methylase [Defluviitaleaceae bacterium]
MLEPQNRRYIGNKHKIIPQIQSAVADVFADKIFSFADIFAGTGVVGYYFAKQGHSVILNDTLFSNTVIYNAWCGGGTVNASKIAEILADFNALDMSTLKNNYFSEVYGGKYYSENMAKTIGYIRNRIDELRSDLTEREYHILLTSLLFYADKIANTVGHFEHYLKKPPQDYPIALKPLNLATVGKTQIYNKDANALSKEITADIVYIDPPYNARQYVNFYHVLENLAKWEKPTEFEGISMKFKRNHLKSGYSRAKAPQLMAELLATLQCKLIIVSYNNTYTANSQSSNNRIQEDFLVEELAKRGKISVQEIPHKAFNTGNTKFNNHLEKLYICEVDK